MSLCLPDGRVSAIEHSATGGVHALDDQMIEDHLLLGALDNVFLHAGLGHETVDTHLFRLTNAVRASHRLQVVLRVPVTVEDDYGVCRREVDSEATGARRQEKAEVRRVFCIEMIERLLANVATDSTVQPLKNNTKNVNKCC